MSSVLGSFFNQEMASPTFSLTDILIRGQQTNSKVIVAGVPSRRQKKIETPDRGSNEHGTPHFYYNQNLLRSYKGNFISYGG